MNKNFMCTNLLLILTLVNKIGFGGQGMQDSIPFFVEYDLSKLKYSSQFKNQQLTGFILNKDISEASGLICGRKNKKVLYVVNDHGNENILWLLAPDGSDKGAFYINGAPNRDWEDIAIECDQDNVAQIYIADIGDNRSHYSEIFVYKIVEPDLPERTNQVSHITNVERFVLTYPDKPHNAETFFVDPVSKNWYIITKGHRARVYCADYPQNNRDTVKLRFLGSLPFPDLTGGDITMDGMGLLLKNYNEIFYFKKKNKSESIGQLLCRQPVKIPYIPEVHGESIGWTYDASSFFTTSEKREEVPSIYIFEKRRVR